MKSILTAIAAKIEPPRSPLPQWLKGGRNRGGGVLNSTTAEKHHPPDAWKELNPAPGPQRIRQRKGRILFTDGCFACATIGSSRTRWFSTDIRTLSACATLAIVVSLGPTTTLSRQLRSVAG